MPIPTAPTAITICTEALKLAGRRYPASDEITRAINYGLEFAKDDLKSMGLEWQPLKKTFVLPLSDGQYFARLPTDFGKTFAARLWEYDRSGVITSPTTFTSNFSNVSETTGLSLTLSASDTGTEADTKGRTVFLLISTEPYYVKTNCVTYNSTTKRMSVYPESVGSDLSSASIYYITDGEDYEVPIKTDFEGKELGTAVPTGDPTWAYVEFGNGGEGILRFNRAVSESKLLELDYYADISKMNTDGTHYSYVLRTFNKLLTQGVLVWALQDDNRYSEQKAIYDRMKVDAAALYLHPNNVSEFFSRMDPDVL